MTTTMGPMPWADVRPGDCLVTKRVRGDGATLIRHRPVVRVEIDGPVVRYWLRERWSTTPVEWQDDAGHPPRIHRFPQSDTWADAHPWAAAP